MSNGAASGPNFRAYWYRPSVSIEGQVIERHTLAQIWRHLSDRDRDVLVALAVYNSYREAAAALGVCYGSFRTYVSWARRNFLKLWHAGETPSKHWGMNHPGNGGRSPGNTNHHDDCSCAVCKCVRRKAG